MIQLRPYQERTAEAVRQEAAKGNRRILTVLPTGAGKTHTMASFALGAISKGNKVLAMMHRRGLVEQMMDRFSECGIDSGCIMAGNETSLYSQCQVASLWTYSRRLKLAEKNLNSFWVDAPLILVDEAHHVLNNTYQKILKEYPNAFVVGCTATPTLSTGAGLGKYFQSMVNVVSMQELLDGGYLVPGEYYGPSEPDLRKVPTLMGDWTISGLDKKLNKGKIIGSVVDNWMEHAGDKLTMVFAINRKHAKALCHAFVRRGVPAEYLDAHNNDEERSDVLKRLRNGDTHVVCQVALYTEGTDIRELECLVIARPTRSIGLHRQILGRGARPCNGKKSFMVLDHGGNVRRLGYYEDEIPWTLDGKDGANSPKKRIVKEKAIIRCEKCQALDELYGVQMKGGRCPRCGHTIKDFGKKIKEIEASLVPIGKTKKKTYTMDEKRRWWAQFEYERRRLGKSESWLKAQYKSRFGVWYQGMDGVAPQKPTQEVKNWLTYQRIKYFKSKQKKEMQCTTT
jgi:DNA repair protein RadD